VTNKTNRESELLEIYYKNLGEGYFLTELQNYSKGQGFGLGDIWCVFAGELEQWEEGYFGETGVAYFYDYPAVEKYEVLVVDYRVFFGFLQEVSNVFVERNPSCKEQVNEYLLKIKTTYSLG